MRSVTLRVSLLHQDAKLPAYAHGPDEDAGMDLYSVEDVIIAPGETALVSTGLALELPPYVEGQIRPRSSLHKQGLIIPNAPGTVDPSYRGIVKVLLHCLYRPGAISAHIKKGDRIAQLVIAPYMAAEGIVCATLSNSSRGEGGFGSTGK